MYSTLRREKLPSFALVPNAFVVGDFFFFFVFICTFMYVYSIQRYNNRYKRKRATHMCECSNTPFKYVVASLNMNRPVLCVKCTENEMKNVKRCLSGEHTQRYTLATLLSSLFAAMGV